MKKPAIKLMPDYGCFALWHACGDQVGNINPKDIGLSESLVHDLELWVQVYESHLDLNDPIACSWTKTEEEEFDRIGLSLRERITSEVGEHFSVLFHGIKIKKE